MKLALMASGRGSNFAAVAEACRTGQINADAGLLISNNEDAQVLERAKARNISAHLITDENKREFEEEAVRLIQDHECDLVILAGFMKVLSPYFIEQFPKRILNIHPSLLPAFKGLNAQKQALEYGVKVSGCTVHVVTEDVDSGPIVDQIAVRVKEDDSVQDLSKRILAEEHKLYPRAIQKYISEGVPVTQDS